MKDRKVTILIVPDFEGTPYTFKISLPILRIGAVICGLGMIFFIIMSLTWSGMFRKSIEADRLAKENQQFRKEQQRIAELDARVRNLQKLESQIRRALGVEIGIGDSLDFFPLLNSQSGDTSAYSKITESFSQVTKSSLAHDAVSIPLDEPSIRLGEEMPSLWPVDGFISRGFEWNPVIPGQSHPAVDIAGQEGTVVKAAAGGIVVWSGWTARYGNLVVLAHTDGYFTVYGHNQVNLVEPRQRVTRGAPIVLLGNTGQSSAPHLHFEIWLENQPLDPQLLLSNIQRVSG